MSLIALRSKLHLGFLLIGAAVAPALPAAESDWHTQLQFSGRSASVSEADDGFHLKSSNAERTIPRQSASSHTASLMFDALFALAQAELDEARVAQITDAAFRNGKPAPCECLQTGAKWPYVWTRDIAYATDLALFRFDPQRARNSLEFKLSGERGKPASGSLSIVQDTGSGGSWPVSTDRVAWFLGARHLLGDAAFAARAYNALTNTLAQDRRYAFDAARGLYRGETSFLDWREQTYPDWTAHNVVYIAESYALSTNVLHYEALQLAASMAQARGDGASGQYRQQAAALKAAIDRQFWREDRGLYMSYVSGPAGPQSIEAYDLLGTSLAIVSGVAPPARARRALANYPTWEAGSPVIWPERPVPRIYHNRAIWPFVSAYALRAARALDAPSRIAHEVRSIMRGAALAGSNMENYELTSQAVHFNDQERSGPAVNSPRQIWSVAAYLDMVVQGVFGLTDRDTIEPKIPRELVPMLFGDRDEIRLDLPGRSITLIKPARLAERDNLLVAGAVGGSRSATRITLRGSRVADEPLPLKRPTYAPPTPHKPHVEREDDEWHVRGKSATPLRLYVNGRRAEDFQGETTLPYRAEQQCISLTERGANDIESLPSEAVCVGESASVAGEWPRAWTAPRDARYEARLDYRNPHGGIITGITAAVRLLVARCGNAPPQTSPVVMPHSEGEQASTAITFAARAGQRCTFALEDGFNMSMLAHYAAYTGGEGGQAGPLNDADIGALRIAELPAAGKPDHVQARTTP